MEEIEGAARSHRTALSGPSSKVFIRLRKELPCEVAD